MNYKERVKSTLTSEWGDNLLELPDGGGGGGGGGCSDSGSCGLWVVMVI
jgi:hypothetical protein